MNAPAVTVEEGRAGATVRFAGRLVIAALGPLERSVAGLAARGPEVTLDLSGTEALDTAGAWLVLGLKARLEGEGARVALAPRDAGQAALIDRVAESLPAAEGEEAPPGGFIPWLSDLGRRTAAVWESVAGVTGFLGLSLHRLVGTLLRPRRLRGAALVHHMQEVGFNAFPIVALMAFLIGVVLAFQGSAQLSQFGAEVFVVELIAISLLRELGILLTAIIVAGRSGSAFAASIGSMKIREEIDAMRTLGLDPAEVLVLPRLLALLIMLPVLGFIANLSGLIGGALMSWIELGVSPGMFVTRLHDRIDVWHLGVGMVKAPFFALIIAVVGCWQGMQVSGSAESVGRRTTSAVVMAIFLVIVTDAIFSVFFAELGI